MAGKLGLLLKPPAEGSASQDNIHSSKIWVNVVNASKISFASSTVERIDRKRVLLPALLALTQKNEHSRDS
jgi:hypothetical protein